jgi:hypothetical protein
MSHATPGHILPIRRSYVVHTIRAVLARMALHLPALPPEEIAHHATRKIPRQSRTIQRPRRKSTRLAKLVAPRERQGIRNRQNKRNN